MAARASVVGNGSTDPLFCLEYIAAKSLNAERFLPPTPIRIVVDHSLQDCSDLYSPQTLARALRDAADHTILDNPQIKAELFPAMLDKCRKSATLRSQNIKQDAMQKMENLLNSEIDRLVALAKINPNIRQDEIAALQDELQSLRQVLYSARLRLDALRMIFSSDRGG